MLRLRVLKSCANGEITNMPYGTIDQKDQDNAFIMNNSRTCTSCRKHLEIK